MRASPYLLEHFLEYTDTPGTVESLAPTAVRNCPHRDQPVTIVALLATPEAARPTITNRVSEVAPLRRLQ
ncbi:hypothetical protein ACFU6I_08640 [Streptomyces sp. NPDC057486]|uniref:hypothetical protein n=1 Tax=Streptomyces sp. NPDC057486 TaxID=3346145 RepID=UPI00367673CB